LHDKTQMKTKTRQINTYTFPPHQQNVHSNREWMSNKTNRIFWILRITCCTLDFLTHRYTFKSCKTSDKLNRVNTAHIIVMKHNFCRLYIQICLTYKNAILADVCLKGLRTLSMRVQRGLTISSSNTVTHDRRGFLRKENNIAEIFLKLNMQRRKCSEKWNGTIFNSIYILRSI